MPAEPRSALGRHLLVELEGCDASALDDLAGLEANMVAAAKAAGATVLESVFHRFQPMGVSGVVVIAESHLAVHAWPEHRYAAVDLFTCGASVDPWRACSFLKVALGAEVVRTKELRRGPGLE